LKRAIKNGGITLLPAVVKSVKTLVSLQPVICAADTDPAANSAAAAAAKWFLVNIGIPLLQVF
ncbi:hypothetical protein CWI75_16305, partial [Kineobactrum sediminis]